MKVYLLRRHYDYEGFDNLAAFSSEEVANKVEAKLDQLRRRPKRNYTHDWMYGDGYSVEEIEVLDDFNIEDFLNEANRA